ncbi:MAG: lectin, partial [Flavobacteriaceae bacterium]|nr:lectin [Flavobacteriaceae bacterium]
MKYRQNIIVLALLCFWTSIVLSQTNQPPSITADGDQVYCPLSQINVVENFNISDPDDTTIDAFYIQISAGYQIGEDNIQLTGTHPTIVSTWNISEGKLTLEGVGGNPV